MTRRPAVTLMEVLVTLFIMAIGMLALLALFPLGAVSMAQALKDDRCASAANMAEQFAIAKNIRHDAGPTPYFTTNQSGQTLPTTYNGPSFPVYVDPYFAPPLGTLSQVGATPPFIQRTSVYYGGIRPLLTLQLVDYWFSLPNDITFLPTGIPDVSSVSVERGREYSWAYLLQRPQALSQEAVNLTIVVYRKRPTAVPEQEQTYSAAGSQGNSGLVLTWTGTGPSLKRGVWLLDTTPLPGTGASGIPAIPAAQFYRVTNVSNSTAGQATVDVQPNLANNVTQVVVMDYAAEVFFKGTSWQP